tara:strand:+ start:137 stop:331 length:195 start_codon:yes stop_codon:yes gene_type:complete
MKDTYNFSVKGKVYELFFAEDGFIEIYETENPGKTGFFFKNEKDFTLFINLITDFLEKKINMED